MRLMYLEFKRIDSHCVQPRLRIQNLCCVSSVISQQNLPVWRTWKGFSRPLPQNVAPSNLGLVVFFSFAMCGIRLNSCFAECPTRCHPLNDVWAVGGLGASSFTYTLSLSHTHTLINSMSAWFMVGWRVIRKFYFSEVCLVFSVCPRSIADIVRRRVGCLIPTRRAASMYEIG